MHKRGWTLQELLAPKRVVFYDRAWQRFADKARLSKHIEKATGVPKEALCNPDRAFAASIAQKMSWASTRVTSRTEDMAYCLLGLFDINMPLLYSEGKKAFLRLQQEIIKSTDDETIFAWTADHEVSDDRKSVLLAPYPRYFLHSSEITTCDPSARQFNRRTAPYSITNRGLQLERPLLVPVGYHRNNILSLNCAPPSPNTRNPWYYNGPSHKGPVPLLGLILDFHTRIAPSTTFCAFVWTLPPIETSPGIKESTLCKLLRL